MRDLVRSVQSFVSEKQAIAEKERQLIENLNRVLPQIGYRVVPVSRDAVQVTTPSPNGATARPSRRGTPASTPAGKSLACPHCDRTFAREMHLGRHIAATHSRQASRRKRAA